MYEDFLPLVEKPARYIDCEINAIHKDAAKAETKICLFFPDTYEVGMSHLGLRILYHILNARTDTVCERAFSPWTDYESQLRAAGRPLTSLESNIPLADFDIIGITLQYELSYTNILAGLDLARIPIRAKDRTDSHPLIIAGGPCAVNPEPLSPFIDVFFIGEAEESIHEIVELRKKHPSRRDYLDALARVEGFYVPSLGMRPVRRRFLRDLESAAYPEMPILPLMKPVHDRVTVEVARGCIRGCRFCQAGIIYRPYRERSPERVKGLLAESLRCTGYDELSLASLSSGDYSSIGPLMADLVKTYRDERISISLPSLRIGTLTEDMIRSVAGVRKTGFTLAPEAGTERLRRVINKPVSDLDLKDAAETIFRNGWNVLKLYFMIGLPTETDEDLDGIIRLARELSALGKGMSRRPVQINITVSTFVPKPHTPFQWFNQATRAEIKRKQAYLEQGLRKKGISLKPHHPETSLIEGAFARGDHRIGSVIEAAMRLGCRFDGWSERFDFAKWEEAFRACGLDASDYACRTFHLDEALPWDFVKTGVTRRFLEQEYGRAKSGEITENCRVHCEACGIGCTDGGTDSLGKPSAAITKAEEKRSDRLMSRGHQGPPARIRLKFAKQGRIRFLSHLDLMTLFQRACSRIDLPVAFSQGFNPHPKIAFGPALSVGMESETEYLDIETDGLVDLLDITKALNNTLPQGVRILEGRAISQRAPSLSGSIGRYAFSIVAPESFVDDLEGRLKTFLKRTEIIISREGKKKDIRPGIESLLGRKDQGRHIIEVVLVDRDQLKPRVQDVIEQLFPDQTGRLHLIRVTRIALFSKEGGAWKDPLDVGGP